MLKGTGEPSSLGESSRVMGAVYEGATHRYSEGLWLVGGRQGSMG